MSKNSKTVVAKPVKKVATKAAAKPAAEKSAAKTVKAPAKKAAPKAEKPAKAPAKVAKAAKVEAPKAEVKVAKAPKAAAPKKVAVEFVADCPLATTVSVAGTFNNWTVDADMLKKDKKTGLWVAKISLVPGDYEYKFVCDGVNWDAGDNKIKHV
ncbi:conserved domain protein [Fibrobacter succinogenes subsp. succinogenes S85]|uniref:Conserved domain protein n=1 Tax=Fibrobacter succinogenes (strain ATCC 19169 / S85) TaxID=59374 RepID=C9RRE7_FIBSS|nr:glycogen-binding domain-containing protein [Fibrobacter succinogenes]ACX75133.1 glycoside hydrolase family 13 domain protein [Fibrobacter succinogenes subsp. succinogenes S85]ADL27096.1 conserved domain protein [Fibrobacter succinogenes subsp. succinogenes S85]